VSSPGSSNLAPVLVQPDTHQLRELFIYHDLSLIITGTINNY